MTTTERQPYRGRKRGAGEVGVYSASKALCERCLVIARIRELVVEITRDDDGRWISSRVVHSDPCPPAPAEGYNPMPVAPSRRLERAIRKLA
jgi:hypothetical protein